VPPVASRTDPSARAFASVKAPRAWPKSSLSSSVAGTAAQLIATKGPSLRGLASWIARATSSLPVPLSPVDEPHADDSLAQLDAGHLAHVEVGEDRREVAPTSELEPFTR
jgi:hypothetical protein